MTNPLSQLPGFTSSPLYTELEIKFSLGNMIDYSTWIPYGDPQYIQMFDFDQIQLAIKLDYQTIWQNKIAFGTNTVQHQILDTENLQEHRLELNISGLTKQHHINANGHDVSTMIQVNEIWVNQFPISHMFSKYGKYHTKTSEVEVLGEFLGKNGTCVFEFTTPIYHWLLGLDQVDFYDCVRFPALNTISCQKT